MDDAIMDDMTIAGGSPMVRAVADLLSVADLPEEPGQGHFFGYIQRSGHYRVCRQPR